MMAMDSQALVKLGPISIPESLGNFRLDDHNVVEWSDSDIPGVRHHKARKETGKWINPVNNADIKYQKQEDCKKTERGQEQTRTEVIHGQAPDSEFQILRSHSHFTGSDPNNFNSRVQSSSTSYQMSSSRGVRSTSKSTSNHTTTKTVTVGGRSDDFEQLGLTFQPLDTSTQRERINVSRSGTMGIRRPPTRRHTPVTPTPIPIVSTSTSPDDSEVEIKDEIIVDSDDNFRSTPQPPPFNSHHIPQHHGGLSIVEFKDITPKFRGVMVGFPIEIQLELQTRLRNSSHFAKNGRNGSDEDLSGRGGIRHHVPSYHKEPHPVETVEHRVEDGDSSTSRLLSDSSRNQVMEENESNSTFDFHQRKKSYELESFDSHTESRSRPLRSNSNKYAANYLNLFPPSRDDNVKSILDRQSSRSPSASPVSSPTPPKWDFYDKLHSSAPKDWTLFDPSSSSSQLSKQNLFRSSYNENDSTFERSTEIPIQIEDHLYNSEKRWTGKNEFEGDADKLFGHDNYMITSSSQINSFKPGEKVETENSRGYYSHREETPRSPSPSLPTSLERSRRLLQMLDETPNILPKLREGHRDLNSQSIGLEGRSLWNDGRHKRQDQEEEEETEWQTQRQLSFLNDSLSRILDAGRTTLSDTTSFTRSKKGQENFENRSEIEKYVSNLEENEYSSSTFSNREFDESEMDINGNLRPKLGQVSQTWISSGDLNKPSQKVRDMDVTTSISATHDDFRRGGKKVEFCKTEVHFTADSGKFHIVETDENKPSTSHLFRRKKKDRSKINSEQSPGSEKLEIVEKSDNIVTTSLQTKNLETPNREINTGERDSQKDWMTTKTEDAEITGVQAITHKITTESTKVDNSSFYDMLKNNTINESQILDLKLNTKPQFSQPDDESPSHNILSEYEEMKIQRYLTHLKSPSTVTPSSPHSSQIFNFEVDGRQSRPSSSYRFNNVLYENGSFIPLATRRSLIEMNNNNNKLDDTGRERSMSDNRSSVSITPNSSQPLRLARLEARVATARPNPQITSVELRYELDDDSNDTSFQVRQHPRRSPSPAPPPVFSSLNRMDKEASENNREIYSTRSERISDLIKRSYYKNPELDWTPGGTTNRLNKTPNNLAMSTTTISSTPNNKCASRSIVTIGDYDTRNTVNEAFSEPSPEPILSMDHTWKGPAFVSSSNNVESGKNAGRSLTLLQIGNNNEQPEWISKARNREHRIKDWESVGKQQSTYSTPSQPPDQPPWLDDFIRPRSKTSQAVSERVGVPKISVVYPWQRQTDLPRGVESFKTNVDQAVDSQIVSIIPTPYRKSSLETLGHSRGPKSLPDLPVLTPTHKNEIPGRDSDIILSHSSHHLRKNRETSSNRGTKGLHEHFLQDPPTSPMTTPTATSRSSSNKNKLMNTDHTSTTKSAQSKIASSGVSRRSKQTVENAVTPSGTNLKTHALKEGVIRHSGRSTNKIRAESKSVPSTSESPSRDRNTSSSVGGGSQKRTTTLVGKESPTSASTATTTTTVHRHPLVKVSKLPIRKNLPTKSSSGEGMKVKGGKMMFSKEIPDEAEKKSMKKSSEGRGGGLSKSEVHPSQQQPWRRK